MSCHATRVHKVSYVSGLTWRKGCRYLCLSFLWSGSPRTMAAYKERPTHICVRRRNTWKATVVRFLSGIAGTVLLITVPIVPVPTKTAQHMLHNFSIAFHIKQKFLNYNWILKACRHTRRSYRVVNLYFKLLNQFSKLTTQCVLCVCRQKASMQTIKKYLLI